MLDELCEDYGYERKYAIKLLRDMVLAPSGRKQPGPEPRYTLIEAVVRTIWLASERPCGKRLAPALPLWLRHYERHHDKLTSQQRELLREISPATLDRLLAPARAEHPLRGRCGTKPGQSEISSILWSGVSGVERKQWKREVNLPGVMTPSSNTTPWLWCNRGEVSARSAATWVAPDGRWAVGSTTLKRAPCSPNPKP
jgi:hypothetical protein